MLFGDLKAVLGDLTLKTIQTKKNRGKAIISFSYLNHKLQPAPPMRFGPRQKGPDPDPVLGPQHDTGHNRKLKGGELKMVMDRLGVTYHSDGEMLEEGLVADELPQLFEEEPSLEEVKKAFDVFDENKDGFIEATELQRVLCSLGLKEGSQVEDCRRMIKAFDEDDDGQIDFKEFVKFLDKSFS
ncbi:putative calcium-binding protein CML45 [Vitis vinifera]|uniref:Putative calcium-binding protein CML45 n=1 Tax=Vitis vinifera TaxID=29760 RepID=A0A438G4T3_VITVI|nr:putative calcium-binding protein CML45 [Vitis vinifera]